MVKHVKLFENWAEENTTLPEHMNPNIDYIDATRTVYHEEILRDITNPNTKVLMLMNVNMESFADYSFWLSEYYQIYLSQYDCKYKLKDLIGIPFTKRLVIEHANVKSLISLKNINYEVFKFSFGKLENLKYFPQNVLTTDLTHNPLLSYYGCNAKTIKWFKHNLCGTQYRASNVNPEPTVEQLNDPEFNAEIFCNFKYWEYPSDGINPWNQIYEDPNEVENYSFLFMPFYSSSENFRTKAKEYIENLDITSLDRRDLW